MAHMPPGIPSNSLPPASAEYETAMHSAPGEMEKIHKWKMFRSSKGQTHLDFGKSALISHPGSKQSILLDHLKREAHILPAPASPKAPAAPHLMPPALPGSHLPASMQLLNVKDLGKQLIGGHEAEGKLYTFQPPPTPATPKAPGLPQPSGLPKPPAFSQSPAFPKLPQPGKPELPQPPVPPAPGAPHSPAQTMEVWTHTKLHLPLLTKTQGIPGLQSSVCKSVKGGEPPASLFQIPPGYKVFHPTPPALPGAGAPHS